MNPRPRTYQVRALPLSYPGVVCIISELDILKSMGKRESFLLILIAAFFMLLLYVATFSLKKPAVHPDLIGVKALKNFNREVEVILTGDVMLGRSVLTKSERMKDWAYPFRKVTDRLQEADIVFINLESPFVDNCPRTDSGMKFCTDPKITEGLKDANIGVVNLANNHASNYGQVGIAKTKKVLTETGIDYVGDGNLAVKEIKGTRFGFLGFDFTTHTLTDSDRKLVADSDRLVDVLIVGAHWGGEYQISPTNDQKQMAKDLVEAGADVAVGHHPHWVQETEYIDGRPVYYSLGNFVFDQMWSEQTKKGLVIKLAFKDGKLIREEKLPVYIASLGQPEFVK